MWAFSWYESPGASRPAAFPRGGVSRVARMKRFHETVVVGDRVRGDDRPLQGEGAARRPDLNVLGVEEGDDDEGAFLGRIEAEGRLDGSVVEAPDRERCEPEASRRHDEVAEDVTRVEEDPAVSSLLVAPGAPPEDPREDDEGLRLREVLLDGGRGGDLLERLRDLGRAREREIADIEVPRTAGETVDVVFPGDEVDLGRVEATRRGRRSHEEGRLVRPRNDARHAVREEEEPREVSEAEGLMRERGKREPHESVRERRSLHAEVRHELDLLAPRVILPELGLLRPVELVLAHRDPFGGVDFVALWYLSAIDGSSVTGVPLLSLRSRRRRPR